MPTRRLPATIALCVWTLLVWTTRIANIWNDADLSDGEKWGRTALALSFTVLVLLVGHAVYHRVSWRDLAVKALAGWTIGVWVTRSVGIVTGDHETSFIVVHLVLAVVSIVLSVLAVREEARTTPALQPTSP
jgi:hypothetical protein